MEDQQVMSQNSTERPTAKYASTVQHQVMSQNATTSPNSNVLVGKKKKGKIPDEQGVCGKKISSGSQEKTSNEQELHNSGGKSESEGKNPIEQVLQYNKSSSEYKEDTSNEKELLGCQGKSEPERKIPDKHGLQGEKTQVSPKYKLWELKNQIMCNMKIVFRKEYSTRDKKLIHLLWRQLRRNLVISLEKVGLKEKFPTSMDFRMIKPQVSPKYELW
jgi:hypothetical protein